MDKSFEYIVECLECRYKYDYEGGDRCLWMAPATEHRSTFGNYLKFNTRCPKCGSKVVFSA